MDAPRFGAGQRALRTVGRLVGKARGDLLASRPPTSARFVRCQSLLDPGLGTLEIGVAHRIDMIGDRGAQAHRIAGEEIERVAEGLRAPEMMLEPMAPALGNIEIVEQRAEKPEIAKRDLTSRSPAAAKASIVSLRTSASAASGSRSPIHSMPACANSLGAVGIGGKAEGRSAIAIAAFAIGPALHGSR